MRFTSFQIEQSERSKTDHIELGNKAELVLCLVGVNLLKNA